MDLSFNTCRFPSTELNQTTQPAALTKVTINHAGVLTAAVGAMQSPYGKTSDNMKMASGNHAGIKLKVIGICVN